MKRHFRTVFKWQITIRHVLSFDGWGAPYSGPLTLENNQMIGEWNGSKKMAEPSIITAEIIS